MTEVATEAKTRTKKGDGPVVLNFLDAENKEASRISDKTVSLQIKDKSDGVMTVNLGDLPENVVRMLAADALKKRIDSAVRATVDTEGKVDGAYAVIKTADEVVKRIMSGQIYARTGAAAKTDGEKSARGRKFDTALWVETMRVAQEIKVNAKKLRKDGTPHVLATQDQLDKLAAKFEAATPAERKKMTDGYLKDATVEFARKKLLLERARDAAKKDLEGDGGDMIELD